MTSVGPFTFIISGKIKTYFVIEYEKYLNKPYFRMLLLYRMEAYFFKYEKYLKEGQVILNGSVFVHPKKSGRVFFLG